MGERLGEMMTYLLVKLVKIMKKKNLIIKTSKNSSKGKQKIVENL